MEPASLVVIVTGLVLGGFVKGLTGMGTPLVSIPILAGVLGVPSTIGLLTVSYLVSNISQIWSHRAEGLEGQGFLPGLLVCGIVGVGLGTAVLVNLPVQWASLVLGVLLVAYCLARLANRDRMNLALATSRRWAPVAGLAAGLLHGATGISSPIGGAFLQAMNMTRSQYLLALSSMLLLFSLVQAGSLLASGLIDLNLLAAGCLALLPVLGGMWAGNALTERMSHGFFDRTVTVLLIVVGIKLLWDGLAVFLGG